MNISTCTVDIPHREIRINISGQFVSNLVSKETVLDSCYTPNSNEEKTLSFKARLDVYKDMAGILGVASLSIKGKEVAKNVYKTGIISSVSF